MCVITLNQDQPIKRGNRSFILMGGHSHHHSHHNLSHLHRHNRRDSAPPPRTAFISAVDPTSPTAASTSSYNPHHYHHHHHHNQNQHQRTPSSTSSSSFPGSHHNAEQSDLSWPFGRIDGLDRDDIREAAYEIFFSSCRSSPGFGGRHALAFYSSTDDSGPGPGSPSMRGNGVGMVTTSRTKRALGLKHQLKRMPSRRSSMSAGGSPGSGSSNQQFGYSNMGGSPRGSGGQPALSFTVPAKSMARRPLTSAEIMRMQMRVTEQSDNRLRKTLMRTLVGQMSRRAETIILPLELLRHLKPSEFTDTQEYHLWQRRQLRILEAGLILHPSTPLDPHHDYTAQVMKLRDVSRAAELKPIDTSKNSDVMRALCSCAVALAWRTTNNNHNNNPNEAVCHWADGYPLNVHIYITLLQSIFDLKDDSMVLDEVDELLELMKKTWSTLGVSRPLHNVCFAWVLFNQYVATGQVEPDLLCAAFTVLQEVAADANKKGADRDQVYVRTLAAALSAMIGWVEKRLMDYHENFPRGGGGTNGSSSTVMENMLPLVLQARRLLAVDLAAAVAARQEREAGGGGEEAGLSSNEHMFASSEDRVDFYIRSSVKNAFSKMIETGNLQMIAFEVEERASTTFSELAQLTEELAAKEKENYSNILKRWHPVAAGIAAVTLHNCYGAILRQYLSGVQVLSGDTVNILQRAGKLENLLVQMVVEDTVDCDDGGKTVVREMVPYEVDSIILRLLRKWIEGRLLTSKECVQRAKVTETWNPRSKVEPYVHSAVDLMNLSTEIVNDFFQLPICISDDLVQDLADGLERVVRDYTTFVASCGTKQNYLPSLPPLTRCNRDSRLSKLLRKASCSIGADEAMQQSFLNESHHVRPTTSRGTQRLYIRLNTLHYLLAQLNSVDKTLAVSPRVVPTNNKRYAKTLGSSTAYFELARASMQGAIQHVSEVAAYRLIFLDCHSVFYECLFAFGVANARIRPALKVLKQNLTLMSAILIDRAQPQAVKEIMKASFEAFLMVLLAGGSTRIFYKTDYDMIVEDFESLKMVFCTTGMGLIAEDEVEKAAEVVEGVIGLMSQTTEQIVEDFSTAACERSGMGMAGGIGQKLPMPPTTGRWNRSDPNTILRVLCHRNDNVANSFLKKTFQLPKRK